MRQGPRQSGTNDAGSNDAAVVQEGNRLGVTLSGADFVLSNGRGNSFVGYLHTPARVNFKISDAWWDDYGRFRPGIYDLVERVSGSEVFVFGSVPAAGTSARLSGPLEGTIARGPATGSISALRRVWRFVAPVRDGPPLERWTGEV